MIRRWQQLSADQAHENAPMVREFAQDLADRTRAQQALGGIVIPELGDAALADQLAVTVYDACRAGLAAQALDGLIRLRHALP